MIGRVIRELRNEGTLSAKLELTEPEMRDLVLVIIRIPEPGKALDESRLQVVAFRKKTSRFGDLIRGLFDDSDAEFDLILVPAGSTFRNLKDRLAQLGGSK